MGRDTSVGALAGNSARRPRVPGSAPEPPTPNPEPRGTPTASGKCPFRGSELDNFVAEATAAELTHFVETGRPPEGPPTPYPPVRSAAMSPDVRKRARDVMASVFTPPARELVRRLDEQAALPAHARKLAHEAPVEERRAEKSVASAGAPLGPAESLVPTDGRMLFTRTCDDQMPFFVPIGEYGTPLAHATMSAARAFAQTATDALFPTDAAFTEKREGFLKDWAFFGEDSHRFPTMGPLWYVFQDAALSFAQALSVLTYHPVEGLDAPALLKKLEEGDLFNVVAKMPLSLLARMVLGGEMPKKCVEVAPSGELRIAHDLKEVIRHDREANMAAQGEVFHPTGYGCPLSKPQEGEDGERATLVAALAKRFVHLTAAFLAAEPPDPPSVEG